MKQCFLIAVTVVLLIASSRESKAQSEVFTQFAENLPQFEALGEPIFHSQKHFEEYYQFLDREGVVRFRIERFREKPQSPDGTESSGQFFLIVREYSSQEETLRALARTSKTDPEGKLLAPDYSFAKNEFLYSLFLLCYFELPQRSLIERKLNLAVLGVESRPEHYGRRVCESEG